MSCRAQRPGTWADMWTVNKPAGREELATAELSSLSKRQQPAKCLSPATLHSHMWQRFDVLILLATKLQLSKLRKLCKGQKVKRLKTSQLQVTKPPEPPEIHQDTRNPLNQGVGCEQHSHGKPPRSDVWNQITTRHRYNIIFSTSITQLLQKVQTQSEKLEFRMQPLTRPQIH
ncbi:unnamed protein product [Pleuronectes platessa]|uniref:Uncharacterized protein n=1 Tax=Pleuronectes platessa TaxID=8262 RepID=A0A9N7YQF0_PLEPL|nr:unnamed protein product [Pleuronectes platessa]